MKTPSLLFAAAITSITTTVTSTSSASFLAHINDDPDMDTIRNRSLYTFAFPAGDAIPGICASADSLLTSLNATCFWPDIDYFSTSRANWDPLNHLSRITTMVQCITYPGSPKFQDPALSTGVHCALNTWFTRYLQKGGFTPLNWWYIQIGCELALQGHFIMLSTNRTSAEEQQMFVTRSYDSNWWDNAWGGGANLVWMITVEILRGAASSNSTALDQAFGAMWQNAVMGNVTSNWQGVVADYAYHFHGQQIMNSAYGLEWIQSLLQFWNVAAGTRWAMDSSHELILAALLAEGNAWLTFGGNWDFGTQGRGVDRPGMNFQWELPTSIIRQLAAQPSVAQYANELLAFADSVDGKPLQPEQVIVGNKYFWTSDFLVHHRATWGASLKMHGNNTLWTVVPIECDNSEAVTAEHLGDGVLNVFQNVEQNVIANGYYEIFPLWDWHQINGATTEGSTPIEPCSEATGDVFATIYTHYVGAATDTMYGVAAMDTATHNTTAQRSWFFFDQGIIGVASNLTNGIGGADVWTTLASRIVPYEGTHGVDPALTSFSIGFANGTVSDNVADGNYTFQGGQVSWLNVGGVGVFPSKSYRGVDANAADLVVTIYNKTGNYNTIGAFDGVVSARLFTAYLDHGNNLPVQTAPEAGYVYLITPNVTAEAMNELNSTFASTTCITASENVHGVSSYDGSVTMVAFWPTPGAKFSGLYTCVDTWLNAGISMNTTEGGLAVIRRTSNATATTISISASHPTQVGGTLVFVLGRVQATGKACAPQGDGSTIFTVPLSPNANFLGASQTVSCIQ